MILCFSFIYASYSKLLVIGETNFTSSVSIDLYIHTHKSTHSFGPRVRVNSMQSNSCIWVIQQKWIKDTNNTSKVLPTSTLQILNCGNWFEAKTQRFWAQFLPQGRNLPHSTIVSFIGEYSGNMEKVQLQHMRLLLAHKTCNAKIMIIFTPIQLSLYSGQEVIWPGCLLQLQLHSCPRLS